MLSRGKCIGAGFDTCTGELVGICAGRRRERCIDMRTKSVCRHGRGQGRVLMLRGMAYIVMALYVRVLMLRGMEYVLMALMSYGSVRT